MKKILVLWLALAAAGLAVSACGGSDMCGYGDYCWVCTTSHAFEQCCEPFPMSPELCGGCVRVDRSLCWE